MPYGGGERLPQERAGRLGHLDVLKSPLVNQICASFESTEFALPTETPTWHPLPTGGRERRIVFGVDGSLQIIVGETPPHKRLAFVKTALLRLDRAAMERIDAHNPHPFALRDLLADAAMYHAAVFPLQYVTVPGRNVYHTIRQVIHEQLNDASLGGAPMETLKWLVYQKWGEERSSLPNFGCPHCHQNVATLPYDAETGYCPVCNGDLYLSDVLGFHLVLAEDSAPDQIASDYMGIHETLMLFTGVRHFWERSRDTLNQCLFVKDGPLTIRAQYSKLVEPIRRFLGYARWHGYDICMVGQEKTGAFVDHLALVEKAATSGTFFLADHRYVREEVQHRPVEGMPYGKDTNYGAKVLCKFNERYALVLNVPTGPFEPNPQPADLIGFNDIVASLPALLSSRYENGLLPIELAHSIASLSTYPSAHMLKLFAERHIAE